MWFSNALGAAPSADALEMNRRRRVDQLAVRFLFGGVHTAGLFPGIAGAPALDWQQLRGPRGDGIAGAGYIAFAVSWGALDFQRTRLENCSVAILSDVTWQRRARSLYFRDPDGYRIEFATTGLWDAD